MCIRDRAIAVAITFLGEVAVAVTITLKKVADPTLVHNTYVYLLTVLQEQYGMIFVLKC